MASDKSAYYAAVDAQKAEARRYVETSLRAFYDLNPDLSAEDFKTYSVEILAQAMQRFGDQAAVVACQEYDGVAAELGFDVAPADIVNEFEPAAVGRSVGYFMRNVTPDNFDSFVAAMVSRANDHVARAANRTIAGNAGRPRDRKAGMRYARVPTGRETCGFCLMLASRGFAYATRRSAGDIGGMFNYYHDRCDCRVVAGNSETRIEGYDPDWYSKVYEDARRTAGVTNSNTELNKVVNEINRRSGKWAWFGENGVITKDEGAKPLPKELEAAEKLTTHGFDVHFRETVSNERRCDIYLTGSGKTPWEIKQPVGNGRQTIYHQFEEAAAQSRRLVLDISELDKNGRWNFEAVETEVKKLLNYHYRGANGETVQFIEVLILEKNGSIRRIKTGG